MSRVLLGLGLIGALHLTACGRGDPTWTGESAVIKVGETVVTLADLIDAVRLRGGPNTVPDAQSGDFAPYLDILKKSLTTQALLLEEARVRGLHVDDAEVDRELQDARAGYPDDFDAFVTERFGSVERYRSLLANKALAEHCEREIRRELSTDSKPTEEEIRAWFDSRRDSFAVPERAKVLQLAAPKREQAEDLRRRLLEGQSLEDLAGEAQRLGGEGGMMGWFEKGSMAPWFEKAVWSNRGGRVTEVLEADGLFRVLQVVDTSPAQQADLERLRDMIEHRLQLDRIDQRFAEWSENRLADLRLKTDRDLLAALTCCRNGLPYIAGTEPDARGGDEP